MDWNNDNQWEKNWWGNCANTYWEESKQRVYAAKMGLKAEMGNGKFPVYDLSGKSVLDIGGGPVSILLKCVNFSEATVIDPCDYPKWVKQRYDSCKINYLKLPGENFVPWINDEVWIYNVLQHVQDPKAIIDNARNSAKIIRIFEWIDTYVAPGHPHVLTEEKLNEWFGGDGHIEELNETGCHGRAYYGLFKGSNYEK